jgi:hypothetical protein
VTMVVERMRVRRRVRTKAVTTMTQTASAATAATAAAAALLRNLHSQRPMPPLSLQPARFSQRVTRRSLPALLKRTRHASSKLQPPYVQQAVRLFG